MTGKWRKGNGGGKSEAAAAEMAATVDGDGNDSVSNNQQRDNHGITARYNRKTTNI